MTWNIFGGWCKAELPARAVGLLKYHCWPSKAFPDASGVREHCLLPELTPGGSWRRSQSDWSNCCFVAVVSDRVEGVTSPAAPPHRGWGTFPILWQKLTRQRKLLKSCNLHAFHIFLPPRMSTYLQNYSGVF